MRVLHVSQPVDAGVARCVEQYATAGAAEGQQVAVACPAGPMAERLGRRSIEVLDWSAQRSPGPSTAGEVQRLAAVVAAWRPDVVHLHSAKAGMAGRLAMRGRLPTLFQPHAWSFCAVGGALRTATLAWERFAARWTHMLLCVSDDEAAQGRRHRVPVPRGGVVVVPNGVDVGAFRAATADDRQAARDRLSLPSGPLAVCLGRLSPQKGQDLLLSGWVAAQDRLTGATLALVGDGPSRAALDATTRPGVLLPGATDDAWSWYTAADVVVVPSRWEAGALVPLEAMATARSVVVSDAPGNGEEVGAGAGAVVPVGDGSALLDAVALRLTDPRIADDEGLAGRRHVVAHHDAVITTGAVLASQRRVVADRER